MQQNFFGRAAIGLLIISTLSLTVGCRLFPAAEKLWGPAFDIALAGERAYVCAGKNLIVIDIKDPRQPVKHGQVIFSDLATSVEIADKLAIVSVTGRGALAVDISDPSRPVVSGASLPAAEGQKRPGELFAAPYLYLNDTCKFYILAGDAPLEFGPGDMPPDASVVGRVVLDPECNVRGRSALFVEPPLAYVVFERHMYAYQLGVIDVSDPARATLLGACPIGESVHHLPRSIVAANGFVYIAATLAGVIVIDVSDPKQPKVAARFKTSTQ